MQRIVAAADPLALSVIVAGELRFGVERKQSAKLAAKVEALLRVVEILPLPVGSDHRYAKLRANLERRRLPISNADLLIAAHALSLSATLVTDNAREFSHVEDLAVENWLRD